MMPRNVLVVAVVTLALLSASVSASLLEATAEPSKDAAAAKKKDIDYQGSVGAARGAKPQPRKLACDITSKGPLCLFGGQTVLSAPAHVSDLVAHYTFDDSYGLDSGAHQLHGETVMPSGPGIFGHGRSALVQNGDGFAVRSSSKFARVAEGGRGAALSFWVYLHGDAETHSDWCTVVAVGQEEGARAALSVDVDPFSGQLRVSATNAKNEIDRFRSVAQLAFDRWHHVVVSRDERTNAVTLYTDGVEDTAAAFGPAGALKEYRLWAGHAPWDGQYCTSTMLIDELRVLSRSMRPFEVQAESFPSLGSVEPDFVRLGCQGCNYAEATERCSKLQRSVCRERELVSGALQVAFALGYGNRKDAFHAYELRSVDTEKKIALCCSS